MSKLDEEEYKGFAWKGKQVLTIGDLGDAAAALETEQEGAAFMAAYFAVNVHAYENVGYVAGYYDAETRERIWRLTESAHPIFGRHNPTTKEAFNAGQRIGEEMKKGRETP